MERARVAQPDGVSSSAMFRAPVCAEVDGVSISGYADQHAEYLRALQRGGREAFGAELFESAVRAGSVVVDGGAYLGFHTIVAARRAGQRGRVCSFEPHPRAFQCLQRNVRENGISDRVVARRECLGDTVGIASFHLAQGDGSQSSLFGPATPLGSRASVCTTLDEALGPGRGVDVVTLDIEGGELHALRGMRGVLAHSPELTLFVAYNLAGLGRADVEPAELLSELDELHFALEAVDEVHRRVAPLDDLDSLVEASRGRVMLRCRRHAS